MKQLMEYKWSLLALGGIIAGLVLSRGGLASLLPLARMLMPLIIILLLFKFVSKKVKGVAQNFVEKNMGQAGGLGQQGGRQEQKIIDLCSNCGSYLTAGHKCK